MASRADVAGCPETRRSVLFVCLGNICRSPLAEGILRHLVEEHDLGDAVSVDSAGTGAWHIGEPPDPRSIEVASRHGIALHGKARQLIDEDVHDFDYVIGMDHSNMVRIEQLWREQNGSAQLRLLRAFDTESEGDLEVPDPYYGGSGGFEEVFRMVERSCRTLLEEITNG